MSVFCEMPKCGARLPNADALAAHRRFIHEDPLAPVPEQPSVTAATRSAVTILRQPRTGTVIDGAYGTPPITTLPKAKNVTPKAQAKAEKTITKVVKARRAAKPMPVVTTAEPSEIVTITGIRTDDMTREEWLLLAVERMRPDFVAAGREVPNVRISIGWPGGRTARLDPLGQCWAPGAVADGIAAIFITPSQDDPVQILATTRHEMVHAAGEMHHRAGFRKLAAQVGFDPQPGASGVSSTYRTPALQAKLEALYDELGPFPHAKVTKGVTLGGAPRVQSTRMLKLVCPKDHYAVRTTAKWLAVGLPTCPKGHKMKVAA